MVVEIVMPRLGWGMEEGVLVEWIKQDGDAVQPGDIVFTVEGDKALSEVESFDSGVLRIPPDSPPLGSTVKVGGLLAYIVPEGEAVPFDAATVSPAPVAVVEPATPPEVARAAIAPARAENDATTAASSPRARRVAGELGIDWRTLDGSGRSGRIVERDVRAAFTQIQEQSRVRATPLARRMAEEHSLDLAQIGRENPGKRIERTDIEAVLGQNAVPAPVNGHAVSAPAPVLQPADPAAVPLSPTRRVIAERMTASRQTAAAVTLTCEVDATDLVQLRTRLKQDFTQLGQPVPSYNDLLIKLTTIALGEHPALNARLTDQGIVSSNVVHMGIAVDTERGLLVPVLNDVQLRSLGQIARESAALIARARAGQLSRDALGGSTFSISNLGGYEIDFFTPIINLPECAILGVGTIRPKAVVVDAETEQIAVRQMLPLSLSFDHRIVDGAPAARFLQRVKQLIEHPYSSLLI